MKSYRVKVLAALVGVVLSAGSIRGAEEKPLVSAPPASQPEAAGRRDDAAAEKLGWRLAVQAYSFRKFTFFEAVDKAASVGIRYIEAYPGQRLSKDTGKARMDHNLPAELQEKVKARLKTAGVKLVNYGVVGLGGDEAKCRKVFEFARKMGIETIVSEPPPNALALIDKLCAEYGINVAIHNHPKPSRYWNPDTVLKACDGRSKRVGACADTGHWMRSGVVPVEGLKKLAGRIVSLHFKDLNKSGRGAHDVVWGTGAGDVKGMLAELARQGFRGVFSVEYEYHWDNSLPEIAECAKAFDRMAGGILKDRQRDKEGAAQTGEQGKQTP